MGTEASEAEELLDRADKKNLKVMVDHTFLFTGAVLKNPIISFLQRYHFPS